VQIQFPLVLGVNEKIHGNRIQQVVERERQVEGSLIPFTSGRIRGHLFRSTNDTYEALLLSRGSRIPDGHERVIEASGDLHNSSVDLRSAKWLRHPRLGENGAERRSRLLEAIVNSWDEAFAFKTEDAEKQRVGLRRAQIGAVHAVHGHWAVTDDLATVVMPTGTGKTETMLSILISASCSKLLVVVPTDALREQLAFKFLTLGVLRDRRSEILSTGAQFPVVCTVFRIPSSSEEADEILGRANVFITTSSIVGRASEAIQRRMAHHCNYLFIDEAHHAEAPTWEKFRQKFSNRRVLQFTATPFREDGKPLDGKIIFKYSLRSAQRDGYFKRIRFRPVNEFNPTLVDQAIAEKAIAQLREDWNLGHILMARVSSVERARQVFDLYARYPEFSAVQLHTGIQSARQRNANREKIIKGEARVVVCVDMLGEGFDLPELKIAAFHDIRKTLAVTLQLAGRFTRSRPNLGDPTFIANTADINVQAELKQLYGRDPDWNILLPELSERLISQQVSLRDFLEGFTEFNDVVPLDAVRPAISTVVYRTDCDDWHPANFEDGIPNIGGCHQVHHAINEQQHTLVVVTARKLPVTWADVDSIYSWNWELYVVVWSPEQQLLFINCSANSGDYRLMATALAPPNPVLLNGEVVFRSFAGVNRLRLQNVGLTEQLGRNVRYTSRMGSDVEPRLTDMELKRASKSVLSGSGFEHGEKLGVGASRKGRIWTHRRDSVDKLAEWCTRLGAKLLDESINPQDILRGTLVAVSVSARPESMPIAIDWPEDLYLDYEAAWFICFGDIEYPLCNVEIKLTEPNLTGELRFEIVADEILASFTITLFERDEAPNFRIDETSKQNVSIKRGSRSQAEPLARFFEVTPPVIWFVDGSSLEGNQYIALREDLEPYDRMKIQVWDWSATDLRSESQGENKNPASIQRKVIEELRNANYDVVMDDDGKGELADVVALRVVGDWEAANYIICELYHCKYSHGNHPGARIDDLYDVCGQAQKSVSWMAPDKRSDMLTHLLRRDALSLAKGRPSRFEVGSRDILLTIREISHISELRVKIFCVQPGVSRNRASESQLMLLSVTENYLVQTFQLPFGVIASA
jgi:superfamily II DNA or RNA helicase